MQDRPARDAISSSPIAAGKLDITVMILTHDEERHIARCIDSLEEFAKDIVIVDSYSEDRTAEIALRRGARVFRNPWVNHAAQFQWGLEHCGIETAWIMRLDADEIVEPRLAVAMQRGLPAAAETVTGFTVLRKYIFMGQWIRHGAMYPIRSLRIWRTGAARVEQRWMDEHVILLRGEAEALNGDIVDYNLSPLSAWIAKHNSYATKEMVEIMNQRYRFMPRDEPGANLHGDQTVKRKRMVKERIYNHLPIFVGPILYFLYRYFLCLGFLDGVKGFAFHFMQGLWYRVLVDLKVLEAESWLKDIVSNEQRRTVLATKTSLKL